MTWQPILTGADREQALAAVRDIVADLDPEELPDSSLSRGQAGLAVMYAYLEQAGLGGGERVDALLEAACASVATTEMHHSLFAGFPGIAWAAEHLAGTSDEAEDPLLEIDAALIARLQHTPWRMEYDLIGGLVGHGVYGLARTRHASGRRLLELVIDRLAETAVTVPPSPRVTWWTSPDLLPPETRERSPHGYYNVGMAHGVPGVVALLGAAVAAGVAASKARPLLEQAVAWLLAQRGEGSDGGQFPYTVSIPPVLARPNARAAWCYGDPGIAIALFLAARAVAEPRWAALALDIGRSVAARPVASCGVIDAGLCHGAAGLAHIYNRFYQATGDAAFRTAALAWTEQLLALRRPGQGFGGYLAYIPRPGLTELGWQKAPGLLAGAAGIVLTLLGLATEHEPLWDRLLLVGPVVDPPCPPPPEES
jgi:lantibiotic modifying enzyme